ncbi:uncharacterized protein TNCV_2414991 [Trichonephila clavipes]|nr:uncharacterized protein TNCV_2414991 [Trichonephila clavipes]
MSGQKRSTIGNVHPGHKKKRKVCDGNHFITQNDTEFTTASKFVSESAAISEIVKWKTCKSDLSFSQTQNNKEFINSLIWTFAPKHLYSGPKTVEIATHKGFVGVLKVMTAMGCPVGRKAHIYVQKHDEMCISHSERCTSDDVKQERIDTRAK